MGKAHHTTEFRKMRGVAIWLYDGICGFAGCNAVSTEVHHIDKINSNNDLINLIPLCNEHHKLVHICKVNTMVTAPSLVTLLLKKINFYLKKCSS